MPTLDVRRVLTAYSRGEATADAVFRACMTHDDWLAPALVLALTYKATTIHAPMLLGGEAPLPADRVSFFTDPEAALAAQSAGARLGTFGRGLSGATLFGGLSPAWEQVFVNPGCPPAETLILAKGTLGLASVWAGAIALENVLAEARRPYDDGDLLKALLTYPDYLVLCDGATGALVTSRTNEFAKAATVFTANDAADAYFAFFPSDRATLRVISGGGFALFRALLAQGFDGVSFNSFGPGVQVTLPTSPLAPVFA